MTEVNRDHLYLQAQIAPSAGAVHFNLIPNRQPTRQMNNFLRALASLSLLLSAAVHSATYSTALIRLEIPTGFEGPVEQHPEPGLKLVGYSKPYPDGYGKTLMLITTYEYGVGLEKMSDGERGQAAGKYLQQLLNGVAKSRSSFSSTLPTPLRLGGVPGMRSQWRGETSGRPMSGVMYCAVPGSRLVCFHTQDFDGAPPGNREAAVAAFEAVVFKKKR